MLVTIRSRGVGNREREGRLSALLPCLLRSGRTARPSALNSRRPRILFLEAPQKCRTRFVLGGLTAAVVFTERPIISIC